MGDKLNTFLAPGLKQVEISGSLPEFVKKITAEKPAQLPTVSSQTGAAITVPVKKYE
jgi:hypothetical protein